MERFGKEDTHSDICFQYNIDFNLSGLLRIMKILNLTGTHRTPEDGISG